MKLILAVDAIAHPLTGIGRYALELARGLADSPDVTSLRYFRHGHWDTAPLHEPQPARAGSHPAGWGAALRRQLAANRLAVRLYHRLAPAWLGWRLRGNDDALFHSPNYFLPPFAGTRVATIHDLSHLIHPQFHPPARVELLNRALPASIRNAHHLIVDAESVRREVMHHFDWPADRITAVPLGVSPAYCPRPASAVAATLGAYGLAPGAYSLCVATIEPRKNIDRLLAAYQALPPALRARHPLVLAGARGWRAESTHRNIARAAAHGWLRYLDYVPQAHLPELYAGAALFVYPSLYEGFGLPVLEAQASGVPVITSTTSSLPEVVGDTALSIDPHDTDALRAALTRGLQDTAWRQHAAARGLARARTFTWHACVARTLDVYRAATAARR